MTFNHSDDFYREVFTGASPAPGQRVEGKQFDECSFVACSLQEAEFVDCSFRDCTFTDCNLSVVKVMNSTFLGVAFRQSKLSGVDWTAARWSNVGLPVVFEEHCVLDLSVFVALKLRNAVFRDSSAHEVDFSDADLSGSDFTGTDLAKARFNRTNLTKARFEGAYNYTIDLNANALKGASFSLPEAASLLEIAGIKIVDRPGRSSPN